MIEVSLRLCSLEIFSQFFIFGSNSVALAYYSLFCKPLPGPHVCWVGFFLVELVSHSDCMDQATINAIASVARTVISSGARMLSSAQSHIELRTVV